MYRKIFHRIASLVLVLAVLFAGSTPALAAAPANDNFESAEVVTSLPFSATVDTTEATVEPDEPPYCNWGTNTAWYTFTPLEDMIVQANAFGSSIPGTVAIYRSNVPGISNLDFINCPYVGESIRFQVVAGTTYYMQVRGMFGSNGNVMINLDVYVPPPPTANFNYWPGDPSKFDTVQFNNWSEDPAWIGIESASWDFGDGTGSFDFSPSHQYSADGDYSVELEVTTWDGRTASVTRVIQVRTHDVAITKISAPKSASAGQIREIVVNVRNYQYPETVQVDLYRSVFGGGFEWIASSKQFVPVRSGTRTTPFSINYTFTSQDAQFGKVVFRATASLFGARDAWPADNEMFSAPVKVTK